jgi:hypothetical protein
MLTVGEILKQERERQKIPISSVIKQIKVREKFIIAIEENNWKYFTSTIYISGLIKNYSKFLGLEPKKILAFFRRDYEKKEEIKFKKKISSKYLTPETKKAITFFVSFILFLFIIYFGYQLKIYFSPPVVAIVSPTSTKFRSETKIIVKIKTEKEAMVTVSGERIYQNKEGSFEYELPLQKGKNEITVEVVGANGKKTVLKKTYIKE